MRINSIHDLTVAVRGRRIGLGLSQAELAARVGVSRQWISAFEGGRPRAELGLVIRLLHALELNMDLLERGNDSELPTRGGSVNLDALLGEYRDP